MGFYLRTRSHKAGTAPGTVAYTGSPRSHSPEISLIRYTPDRLDEQAGIDLGDLVDEPGVTWLDVNGVHDPALLRAFGKRFGLHPLSLEDTASTLQRAKIDDYDTHAFVILRMIHRPAGPGAFSEQVSIAFGPGFVISFQEREGDVFEPVRTRIRQSIGRIRRAGSDYLAYALIDVIVDNYFVVLETLSEELEALESEVLVSPPEDTLPRLRRLRAQLVMIRRAAWPLREVASRMLSGNLSQIKPDSEPYLRDLYDHVLQIIDIVESMRDVAGSVHDLYMAAVSNRMNEIMKFLTIVGTIFIPLTFIAGIYGMNFAWMPELAVPWAYPAALVLMGAIAVGLVFYFKRKEWL